MMEADIPAIPNGWFYLLASVDLAKEHVKHVTACGEHNCIAKQSLKRVAILDIHDLVLRKQFWCFLF